MTPEEIKAKFEETASDAIIVQFSGNGMGEMAGVQEYIVICEDEDDIESAIDPCPGFTLDKVYYIQDSTCRDRLSSLPFSRALYHRS